MQMYNESVGQHRPQQRAYKKVKFVFRPENAYFKNGTFIWEKEGSIIIFIQRQIIEQMTESRLNKRHLYKTQKLQQNDEIFYCQCGKNYLTFSALYLHTRNKHNYKLTTKRSHQVCKTQIIQNKSIVTYFLYPQNNTQSSQPIIENYFYSQKQNQSHKINLFQGHIKLLQLYQGQHKLCLNSAEIQVLSNFKNYLQALDRLRDQQKIDQISDLTLYFNDFVIYSMSLQQFTMLDNTEKFFYLQKCLVKLWFWMKKKNYTEYELLTLNNISNIRERIHRV